MSGVAVHVVVTVGCPAVGEQYHNLVGRLWVLRQVILEREDVRLEHT